MRVPIDVVGDIAILKFSRHAIWFYKKWYALRLLKEVKHLKVVLEKIGKFDGELRIQKTKYLAGENRTETLHRESDCEMLLDINQVYFSPRLSQERKVVAEEIVREIKRRKMKNSKILIMFGGVAPQALVLGRLLKKEKLSAKIVSSELNKSACEYAKKNVRRNRLEEYIEIAEGDSRKFCIDCSKRKVKFDFILMLRPNLEDTFLSSALKVSKKGTIFYYHGFGEESKVKNEVLNELKLAKKKFSGFKMRKAGDIGVNSYRWNLKFKV